MGASFLAQNGGKKSITLNLKSEAGEVLRRLVRTADVLVENFRPGVMDRLGLGYRELREFNQSLVYCAISGFGQNGPMKDAPAYDQIIQGLSGMMSVTGNEDSGPLRAGYPVADTIGGPAAFAIAAALLRREPQAKGGIIDVAMLDSAIVPLGWVVSNRLIAGVTARGGQRQLHGRAWAPSEPGRAVEHCREQTGAVRGPRPSGRTRGPDGRRALCPNECRKRNRASSLASSRPRSRKSAAEWEAALNRVGVPAGRVLTVPEALELAQIKQREFLRRSTTYRVWTAASRSRAAASSCRAAIRPCRRRRLSSASIRWRYLHAIGYSNAEIGRLQQSGAVQGQGEAR